MDEPVVLYLGTIRMPKFTPVPQLRAMGSKIRQEKHMQIWEAWYNSQGLLFHFIQMK